MNVTRTPIITALPVSLADVKDHLRVSFDDDDAGIETLTRAAALEVEAQCDLALLSTTITATTDEWPGRIIDLPVGPVADGATATVAMVEVDGTTTPVVDGFWLETGRYPRLHFSDTEPGGRLRITYAAGLTATPANLPADLRHAIAEQAARMFDHRGGIEDKGPALSAHAARVIARYRRVKL